MIPKYQPGFYYHQLESKLAAAEEENKRLREAVQVANKAFYEIFDLVEGDKEMKAMKVAMAFSGFLPGYRADATAFRETLTEVTQ